MSYFGRVLWVNLSSEKIWEEKVNDRVYENFLGGYGLAAKIIFERQVSGIDPFSPESILCFAPGMLTGTSVSFSGRYMVAAKSPATGGWGDANSGGKLGPEIKKTGYDAIFFVGRAEKPIYFQIDNNKKEIRSAKKFWGKDAVETEKEILSELKSNKFKIAAIGKGGEKLSCMAGIVTDRGRTAARMGLGAVMGSKNLKAIALRGEEKVLIYDGKEVKRLNREFLKKYTKLFSMTENFSKFQIGKVLPPAGLATTRAKVWPKMPPDFFRFLQRWNGTAGWAGWSFQSGDTPVKNWKGSCKDFSAEKTLKITEDSVHKYRKKRYACMNCPLGCGGILEVDEGPYPLEETHTPEYESLGSLGAMTLCDDLPTILKINDLCNREGIDTISLGSTLSFALECFEKGILKEDEVGMKLEWGDPDCLLYLTRKIIDREGIGDVLADGVKRASERIGKGSEEFAIHSGGMEPAMHDPRTDPGYGIAYECEPTPGRHTTSIIFQDMMEMEKISEDFIPSPPLYRQEERYRWKHLGENTAIGSEYFHFASCAGLCIFGPLTSGAMIPITEWINAATGWNLSHEEGLRIGERILTLKQAFNAREGLKPFKLTPRARGLPPLKDGKAKGISLDMDALDRGFYGKVGWDPETGKPSKEKLEELGLKEAKKALYDGMDS